MYLPNFQVCESRIANLSLKLRVNALLLVDILSIIVLDVEALADL
jgi:hypothetical protein